MENLKTFVRRYSLPLFFILTFTISWGAIVAVIGLDGLVGASQPADELLPLIYVATLLGPSVAGLLMIGLVDGRAGFQMLRTRLFRWRVGVGWYAVALLTAPLLLAGTLFALSLFSPAYTPGIITAGDKGGLLLAGFTAGLMVGIFEELGWTGFAAPRLRLGHTILASGLIIGLLWGLWHFPLFSGARDAAGAVPVPLYIAVLLFSFLPPFRVLMVWLFDRTESLLLTMLMHASLTASILIFPPQVTGTQVVTYDLVFAACLWLFVALIAATNGGQLAQNASG